MSIALELGISTPPTEPSNKRFLLRMIEELVTIVTVVSLKLCLNS